MDRSVRRNRRGRAEPPFQPVPLFLLCAFGTIVPQKPLFSWLPVPSSVRRWWGAPRRGVGMGFCLTRRLLGGGWVLGGWGARGGRVRTIMAIQAGRGRRISLPPGVGGWWWAVSVCSGPSALPAVGAASAAAAGCPLRPPGGGFPPRVLVSPPPAAVPALRFSSGAGALCSAGPRGGGAFLFLGGICWPR